MSIIEIEYLNKEYGSSKILKDINLSIKKGECIILQGVSGSGKTTLLGILVAGR